MNKLSPLAAVVAAVLIAVVAPACAPANAAPLTGPALEVMEQSVASLDGVALEYLRARPEAARLLNSSGVFTQGLNVIQADVPTLTTGEKDTGYDFTAGDVILDVWAVITTAETTGSTKTIDIGLLSSESGGDTDGFANDLVTSATGTIVPATTVNTAGVHDYLVSTTYGALLLDFQAGQTLADAGTDEGVASPKRHVITSTAKSLVYQLGSAHTELRAKFYVLFWRKPL